MPRNRKPNGGVDGFSDSRRFRPKHPARRSGLHPKAGVSGAYGGCPSYWSTRRLVYIQGRRIEPAEEHLSERFLSFHEADVSRRY